MNIVHSHSCSVYFIFIFSFVFLFANISLIVKHIAHKRSGCGIFSSYLKIKFVFSLTKQVIWVWSFSVVHYYFWFYHQQVFFYLLISSEFDCFTYQIFSQNMNICSILNYLLLIGVFFAIAEAALAPFRERAKTYCSESLLIVCQKKNKLKSNFILYRIGKEMQSAARKGL